MSADLPAMRGILIIAYYYPPMGGVGVLRTLKFTKYLPQFGFAPFILTVRNRSFGALDASLLPEVPPGTSVVETFSLEHRFLRAPRLLGVDPKWFFIPDAQVGWLPFAVRTGEAIIRQHRINVIFATGPPFTSLLAGYVLKRRTGRPLVVDYRDPWTQNVFTQYPTQFHRKIEERLERAVLGSADRVITTTDEMTRGLASKYTFVRNKCETIPNGFDAADFLGLTRSAASDRFTIAYTGTLYGLRTAEHFLAALRNVVANNHKVREKIRVVFAGLKGRDVLKLVHKLGLEDIVRITGFVPHRESLQIMVNADVLLLVMSQREVVGNGVGSMMIPGKTFEYLAARRPILALAPDGDASALISKTGSGIVVPPDDREAIARSILDLFTKWQMGTLSVGPYDISSFERRSSTARLAASIESLCSD